MSNLRDFTGKNRVFTGTDSETISSGTTAQRVDGTAKLRFNTTTNLMEYYTGTDWKSIDSPPLITQFTVDGGSDVTTAFIDSSVSGSINIEVKGSLFDTTGATVVFEATSGANVSPTSTTRNSANLLTVAVNKEDFLNAGEPYAIKVTNGSGLSATLSDAINVDGAPAFVSGAGSLGSVFDSGRTVTGSTLNASATDPDSDTITYSIVSGSLPSGLSLSSSTGYITGTADAVGSDTTSNFTVRAATASQNTERAFSITIKPPVTSTYTSTGSFTFSVPSGLTAVDVLVVGGGGAGGSANSNSGTDGGGGGGAGGLIYRPGFPVTPGAQIPGNVGAGYPSQGTFGQNGPDKGNGGDSVFGTLTAKGGGTGADGPGGKTSRPGGSGAGAPYSSTEGTATQPGQPGDSGNYGFGNNGGDGNPNASPLTGSGGGGAGGAGSPRGNGQAGPGGVGKQYSISGSNVYYAGGGAGGGGGPGGSPSGSGGNGGGGNAPSSPARPTNGQPGTANRGGGGGAGAGTQSSQPGSGYGAAGGSGIVIVSY